MILSRPQSSWLTPQQLAQRQTDEIIDCGRKYRFSDVVALEGKWLAGVDGAEPPLLSFRECARYMLAAQTASSYSAVDHLKRAESFLITAGNQILRSQTPLAVELPRALAVWKEIVRSELDQARERAASQLPNPFRAGQPLRPDQGRDLFRGRDAVVRQIESILMEASQSGSIALLGPRRCGKTSLLQMLPTLVPDCICVFFDLQDNPVDSPEAFFEAIHKQAWEQAWRDRRIELPRMASPANFSAATDWFQALDGMQHQLRILLCLDEFERLEELFPGDRRDLLRLMGLFRATIQHRQRVRLLVSGVAPFDELGALWNDHFINVRQIRVGHLDRATAIDLLMRPIADFPEDAIPEDVAAHIYERTGGQPYLLQLYGSLLITRLNQENRRNAELPDLGPVETEALEQGAYYFRHSYQAAPPPERAVLEELACGRKSAATPEVNRWLMRRGLINDAGDLATPALGAFMKADLDLK